MGHPAIGRRYRRMGSHDATCAATITIVTDRHTIRQSVPVQFFKSAGGGGICRGVGAGGSGKIIKHFCEI